jgi:hypothetical protein
MGCLLFLLEFWIDTAGLSLYIVYSKTTKKSIQYLILSTHYVSVFQAATFVQLVVDVSDTAYQHAAATSQGGFNTRVYQIMCTRNRHVHS